MDNNARLKGGARICDAIGRALDELGAKHKSLAPKVVEELNERFAIFDGGIKHVVVEIWGDPKLHHALSTNIKINAIDDFDAYVDIADDVAVDVRNAVDEARRNIHPIKLFA